VWIYAILKVSLTKGDVMERLTPANGCLLVRVLTEEEMSAGGIVLPNADKKEQNAGQILSTAVDAPVQYPAGTVVYFPRWAGHRFEYNNESILCLTSEEVLAYLMPDEWLENEETDEEGDE
jgi:co-chaperonin GroES (HSP10)